MISQIAASVAYRDKRLLKRQRLQNLRFLRSLAISGILALGLWLLAEWGLR